MSTIKVDTVSLIGAGRSQTPRTVLSSFLLAIAAILWGGNYSGGRILSSAMTPAAIVFWRWAIVAVVLAPFVWKVCWCQRKYIIKSLPTIVLLSVLGLGGFSWCLYTANEMTSTINTAMTLSSCPLLIPVFCLALYGDRLTVLQIAALVISLAGVGILCTKGDLGRLSELSFGAGDLWAFAAALVWSLYCALLRSRPKELSPLVFLFACSVVASLIFAPAAYTGMRVPLGGLGISSWGAIVYLSLGVSLLGFWAWNRGVQGIGPVKAGHFMHIVPLSAALLAVTVWGEALQGFHIVGSGLIAAGLALASVVTVPDAGK